MSGSFSPCVVFTQMWLTLLVVTPVNGQHEAAQQSVVSLQPPWTTFFRGEVVTLTCYRFGFSVPQKTKWYQKRKTVKQTPGALVIKAHTLKVHESGEYWCQADSLLPSMHVNVEFSEDFLVLQAPPAVFEGDSVVLRCYAKKGIEAETLTFYKDGKALTLHHQSELSIHHANLKDNGQYKCTSKKKWSFGSLYTSNTVGVQVQVPVSQPVLTLSTGKTQALEGDLMTLHCQSQRGSPCILYEFFYENVSLGNSSILSGGGAYFNFSMSTERSGNYYCTADNGLGAQCSEAIRISIF
ncbi:Fc receptor-like 5, isoform CRA_b, partial [Mus musculus]